MQGVSTPPRSRIHAVTCVLRAVRLTLTIAAMFSITQQAIAHSMRFDVPAGPACITWLEYGEQVHSKLDLLCDDSCSCAILTHAVHGRMDPAEALARMLRGTGLVMDRHRSSIAVRSPRRGRSGRLAGHLHAQALSDVRRPCLCVAVAGMRTRWCEDDGSLQYRPDCG